MGCATSKQKPVCRNCKSPYAPMTRSFSMHVHHPPQTDDDSYHLVALQSTTLGYLDQSNPTEIDLVRNPIVQICPEPVRRNAAEKDNNDFAISMIDAKSWSKMIDEKIPKFVPRTPIMTPPGEPETINAWELMEGLDDTSPLRPNLLTNYVRSFSFHVNPNSFAPLIDEPKSELPDSVFGSIDKTIASEFDTDVITEFRKSLSVVNEKEPLSDGYDDVSLDITKSKKLYSPPRVKEKLVLYFTSLRGVRKTYEDCCHVRHLLKATGVRVDERDVSMHSGFKEELKELLGGLINGLPKVFIGKKCIGGAIEIRRLHEDGNLEKELEGCEMMDDGGFGGGCGVGGGGCDTCGDIRFVPCETCSGSCKIYYEDKSDETDEDEEKEETDYGFQRCPDCNENGLVRCPICCD